jgi:hypothetical protein
VSASNGVKSKAHAHIPKAFDLQLSVRTLRVEGTEYVDIRDFVPSTKEHGRGVLFERRLLGEVIEVLSRLDEHLGGTRGLPVENHPDQGQLL